MRQGSGEATRERILESAARLFVERGFAATTVQDIVDDAAVTKGALYHHFTNKDEILLHFYGVLETSFETMLKSGQQSAAPDLSASERVTRIVHEVVRMVVENRTYASLWIGELRMLRDEKLAMLPKNSATDIQSNIMMMSEIIEEGIATGEFRDTGDTQAIAYAILTMPLLVHAFFEPDRPIELEETASRFSEFFLGGLRSSIT